MFELVFPVQRNASTYLPLQCCGRGPPARLEYERGTLQGPPINSDLIGQWFAYWTEKRTNKQHYPDRWSDDVGVRRGLDQA